MWIIKFLLKLQPIIVVVLFIVFFVLFGWPAYNTFVQYDVFIKESLQQSESLPAPAVTICIEAVSVTVKKSAIPLQGAYFGIFCQSV